MNEAVSTLGVTMKPPGSANEDAAASKRAACAAHLKSSSVLGGSIVDDPRVKDLLLDVDGQVCSGDGALLHVFFYNRNTNNNARDHQESLNYITITSPL